MRDQTTKNYHMKFRMDNGYVVSYSNNMKDEVVSRRSLSSQSQVRKDGDEIKVTSKDKYPKTKIIQH